ncbi:uncharacterized protein ISCGN_024356 [Ixodes scapularis]
MTGRTTACAITAALLLAFSSVQSVSGACDVKPKPGVAPRQYPNIFESYPKGFKLSAEVNDRESKTTMFLTEYFDTRWHQGLLKLTSDGVFTNIYYRTVSEEIFIFDDHSCETVSLKNTPKDLETMALRLQGYTILGASALFIGPSIPGGYKSTGRTTTCAITAALLLAFSSVQSVSGACDVKPKPGVAPRQYPNIFESYPKGFKLSAEVNDRESKTTMFLTEYFDTRWHQGLLKLTSDGVFTNIYYRTVSEEIFIFDDHSCETVSLKNTPKDLETMALRLQGYTILGASALFIGPSIPGGYKSAYQGQGGNVRGIRTQKWSTCVDNESEPVDIFFAEDPGADLGKATSKAVPVRIQQGKETTDIMMMQPYENDRDKKFKIPIGLGCTRLAANLPKPPDLSKVTMEFHSELTFSDRTLKNSYSYMSHLDTIYNTEKQLFSYIMEPWETSAPIKPTLPQDATQKIWDARNGMVYKQGTMKGRPYCTIEAQSNYSLRVTLPDRNSANMLEIIFLDYDVLQNASYLGRHVVRGIPTETFEIATGELPAKVDSFTKAIVTYHYLPVAMSQMSVANAQATQYYFIKAFLVPGARPSSRVHLLKEGLVNGVTTVPQPCGFVRPRLAVRAFPVSRKKVIVVVELSPG